MLVILAALAGATRKNIAATNTAIMPLELASLSRRENELVPLHITQPNVIQFAAISNNFKKERVRNSRCKPAHFHLPFVGGAGPGRIELVLDMLRMKMDTYR